MQSESVLHNEPVTSPYSRWIARENIVIASSWLARLVLAGVFVWAAIPKITDPTGFALSIHRYELLPIWMESPSAIILPWFELVLAVALLSFSLWRVAALILTFLLLIAFTGMISWAWFHGLEIACGCFSTDGEANPIGWQQFARNIGLLGLTGWAFWVDFKA